jgi:hypothetical protein
MDLEKTSYAPETDDANEVIYVSRGTQNVRG